MVIFGLQVIVTAGKVIVVGPLVFGIAVALLKDKKYTKSNCMDNSCLKVY